MPAEFSVRLASAKTQAKSDLVICSLFEDQPVDEAGLPQPFLAPLVAASPTGAGSAKSARVIAASESADLLLLGLGKSEGFEAASLNRWAVEVLLAATRQQARRPLVSLPNHPIAAGDLGLERCALALLRAGYRFDSFRKSEARAVDWLSILAPQSESSAKGSSARRKAALSRARAIASGQALCRTLANTPPNVANPAWMASQARQLARKHGFRAKVMTEKELRAKGMGGILAVGGGSASPPRLVRISTTGRAGPRVALVGKGVTFDTGGISIKPAASMEEMKFDKCGACTVLGVLETVGRLGLDLRLDAYLPLVENMPDAAAYRPGDIVDCYNGKSVEIINTDAEGRMILADAMAWAAESKPDYLIELSTLTGACVVALGTTGAGLFAANDELANSLLASAEICGERLWRLPLWPEFKELMKGDHADLKNAGGRWGGASTAAAFLSHFVGEVAAWAHIDLAGPAYSDKPVSNDQAGATGYGVELLVRWLSEVEDAAASGRVR